ncbi:alpha/beta fold hydrolase [Halobacillus salinarum]|uniref:Alpha/beta fold hydrolase n=1 Tax=Halobacillus salinarum TaxID=2932257 RepID=A0ABY4EIV8_9BACI|nr:alpha/beta fold hydrolase [Halobacillus salinarum]UOQ44424.1 alpha/beta fold hydrolase [Halobacillus salinarum]
MNYRIYPFYTKRFLYMTILLLIGTGLFFLTTTSTSSEHTNELTPTLFVHGFKGGPGTYNTMLARFEENEWGKQRMIVYVSSRGRVSIRGGIPHSMNPFIQVIFENNRASVADQTFWLKKVLHQLHEKRGIDQVNLVGHSMGGLASTNFLLNNQDKDQYPAVKKLVVIASPFQGIERDGYFDINRGAALGDLHPNSMVLQQMVEHKDKFDSATKVLAIAGVINENEEHAYWDGLVSASSALGISSIAPKDHYKQALLYDPAATHSGLHEFTEVDNLLANFLWDIQSE